MFPNTPDVFANVAPEHRPDAPMSGPPMGATPDGLGARVTSPMTGTGEYFQPAAGMGALGPDGMGGEIAFLEPVDASPSAALQSAGITALVAAMFFGGGLALGGPWGGMSGVLFSGSLFNIYRAQKWWGSADASEKHEAVVSAVFGTITVAAGAYAGYQAYQTKK